MHMNRFKRFLLLGITFLIATITFHVSAADGDPISYLMDDQMWNSDKSFGEDMESKSEMVGSKWKAIKFYYPKQTSFPKKLQTGYKGRSFTAELISMGPISDKIEAIGISTRSACDEFSSNPGLVKSIIIKNSDNADFIDCDSVVFAPFKAENIGQDFGQNTIKLPNPSKNQFYKIEFELNASSNNNFWLGITQLDFYLGEDDTEEEIVPPVFDSKIGEDGRYKLVSNNGDLHVLIYEYDKDHNFIKEIVGPATENPQSEESGEPSSVRYANGISRAPYDNSDTSWLNKVANQNEEYYIDAPDDDNNYRLVRSKSVINAGTDAQRQSDETVTSISKDAVVTGAVNIEAYDPADFDADKWFTLQGVGVDNPQNGLYIRIRNGKAEKVIVKN